RPQDVATIGHYCDELAHWTIAATELLAPEPRVFLPMPCPRCGARFAYRFNSSGEQVRTGGALRVSERGCECGACHAHWQPEEFHWLARLIGCEAAVDGVIGATR